MRSFGARRIVTQLAAVATAVAATMLILEGWQSNGLDRRQAGPLPLAFRPSHDALRLEAETQLFNGRMRESATAARQSLATSPLDHRALRVLALTADRTNDHAGARRLMILAAALSRHEASAQLWLMRDDVLAGNMRQVATRADAILRADPDDDLALAALALLLGTNDGQDAVAARLALAPPWRDVFFRTLDVGSAPGAAGAASLLDAMRNTVMPPSLQEVAAVTTRMVVAGFGGIAQAYWQGVSPTRGAVSELIDDPDFAASAAALQRGEPGRPFGWMSDQTGDVDFIGGRDAAGRGALMIDSGDDGATGFVYRYVMLSPGFYRLSFAAREESGPTENVSAQVACVKSIEQPKTTGRTVGRAGGYARVEIRLTVPTGCSAVKLSLTLAPGDGYRSRTFSVRDVHLQHLSATEPANSRRSNS